MFIRRLYLSFDADLLRVIAFRESSFKVDVLNKQSVGFLSMMRYT